MRETIAEIMIGNSMMEDSNATCICPWPFYGRGIKNCQWRGLDLIAVLIHIFETKIQG
jgi:hypothetical protein